MLRAIEEEWRSGGDYQPTSGELAAIDEDDRGGLATDDEVETAFGFFRTEDRTSGRRLRN